MGVMTGLLNDPVLLLGLMAFGALLLALPLAFWNLSGEPRSSTSRMVQLLVVAANLLLTAQLLVERSWPSPLVPAATTPMALVCVAFASFALPDTLQNAAPLVPALRSSWLVMHVSVIMMSYAALLVGSLLSAAVLFTHT